MARDRVIGGLLISTGGWSRGQQIGAVTTRASDSEIAEVTGRQQVPSGQVGGDAAAPVAAKPSIAIAVSFRQILLEW